MQMDIFATSRTIDMYNQGIIRLQVRRIDEPIDHDPLESDEIAWQLAKLAGLSLDENGFVL